MRITPYSINQIKERINDELMKRSFPSLSKIETRKGAYGAEYIYCESEPFQTVPCIFREINVQSFSSSITSGVHMPSETPILNIWIAVHVSYEMFGGGSNGSKLFDFTCEIDERELIYNVRID